MADAPKSKHLPLPASASREATYTAYSPSPSDVAAWQEQPRRIKEWRNEVPMRSKAVQPESGSSLSMAKGAGVGSAEWSERDKGSTLRVPQMGSNKAEIENRTVANAPAGQKQAVRSMGSNVSDTRRQSTRPPPLAQRSDLAVPDRTEGRAMAVEGVASVLTAGVVHRRTSNRIDDGGPTGDNVPQPKVPGSTRQMNSTTSARAPRASMRRPDPPVLPTAAQPSEQSLLVPAAHNLPKTSSSPSPSHPTGKAPRRLLSDAQPRSAPSTQSARSARDAYIADALAIPDEARPSTLRISSGSQLNLPAQVHSAPLRKSLSAASRRQQEDVNGTEGRKAKFSGTYRKEGGSPNRQTGGSNLVPPLPAGHQYRSAATTPVNPFLAPAPPTNTPMSLSAPPQQTRRSAPNGQARASARLRLSHVPVEGSAQPRPQRSDEHEPSHQNPTALRPTASRSHRSQRPLQQDEPVGLGISHVQAPLQAHFDPAVYPLPPSVMSASTLVAQPNERSSALQKDGAMSDLTRVPSTSRHWLAPPFPRSPELITPQTPAVDQVEYLDIPARNDGRIDAANSHAHASPGPPSSELSNGQPDHISFEVPSGSRGRLRVSLAWFKDRDGTGRRRRRHTDNAGLRGREGGEDDDSPPPVPPKYDLPPRSPVRRQNSARLSPSPREGLQRSSSYQRQPSPLLSPRRYDTSPSQYTQPGNPMLHRSNTYMTNLPPYQAAVPAYRVQFPQSLNVPMGMGMPQQQQQRHIPHPAQNGWAMASMPQLHAPPPTLASPTRFGPSPPTQYPGAHTIMRRDGPAYTAPLSPRQPPSVEPPSDTSPPAPLRRLPSTRMDMPPAMTGYGGVAQVQQGQGGRMPLSTPMVLRQQRPGPATALPPDDRYLPDRYRPNQPTMWQRKFANLAPRSRYPYPDENPTDGRINKWRKDVRRPPPDDVGARLRQEERDQREVRRYRDDRIDRYGDMRDAPSALSRFFGGRYNRRPPPPPLALEDPPITPYPSNIHSAQPGLNPENMPYTPAPKTKFGNLTLRGRSRRFKTYQPTQIDAFESQRRQKSMDRRKERDARKEEKRTLRRAQREQRDRERAEVRERRIAAATRGAISGGGLTRVGTGGQEQMARLQRQPSERHRTAGAAVQGPDRGGIAKSNGAGVSYQRGVGGIGEWLAKVQLNRARFQ